jgi:hypothetical protein
MKHRTMQGKEIDMGKLMRQNELMPAIGNMKVNARGDELGPGGTIVRKREDIVAEYYEKNPASNIKSPKPAVPAVKSADTAPDVVPTKKKSTEE